MTRGEAAHRRTLLSKIITDLGETLLHVVEGPVERPVGGLTIVDSARPDAGPDEMLLGINVTDAETAEHLLSGLAGSGAAALMLKAPVASEEAVRKAAAAAEVTVIEVSRGVAWGQLFTLLRRLLDPPEVIVSDDKSNDLFQLANEIGALLDAPITIVDPEVRVLAYSVGQENTDEARILTVLSRQVPAHYQQLLREHGVFEQLAESADPIHVPSFWAGSLPRTVIAVRVGAKVLGSVWAVSPERMSDQRLRAFKAAADIVAIHLLRERAATTAGSRLRTEQLAVLLNRDEDPAEPARRLGVVGITTCVIAVEIGASAAVDAERANELQRVADALSIHLRLVHRASAVAILGDVVYGLTSVSDESAGLRVTEEFVKRSGSRLPLKAAVGRVAQEPGDIALSRADADDVLRLLRHDDRVTASVRQVRTDLMVLRLADVAGVRQLPPDGQVAQLLRHDARHRTDLAASLAAYLETFGDVRSAAAAMHVHPNTFRYRLARLSEVARMDLHDPDTRLAAMIDLRLHRHLGTA